MSATTYTHEQREAIQACSVHHAVFSFIEEYGKEESDFIDWLAQRGVSFSNALTHCGRFIDTYADQLSQEENN